LDVDTSETRTFPSTTVDTTLTSPGASSPPDVEVSAAQKFWTPCGPSADFS
jgi:hypothetical protein